MHYNDCELAICKLKNEGVEVSSIPLYASLNVKHVVVTRSAILGQSRAVTLPKLCVICSKIII